MSTEEPVHDLDRDDDGRSPGASAAAPPSSSFEAGLRDVLRGVDGETGARPLDLEDVRRRGARRRPARAPGSTRVPVLAGAIAAACAGGIVAVTVSALPPASSPVGGPAVAEQPTAGPSPTAGPPLSTPTPDLTGVGEGSDAPTGTLGTAPASSSTVVTLAPGQTFPARDTPGWNPDAVAYELPDLAASPATSAALPAGLRQSLDIQQYRLQPTVPGQACGGPDPGTVAGSQWSWAEDPSSNDLRQVDVTLVVTGWPAGDGPGAFGDVVEDTGACHWLDAPRPADVSVTGADDAWGATFQQNGLSVSRGLARLGDVLVGVEVVNPPSRGTAEVQRLLAGAVTDLADAHLAATGR